jgi:hypothetical protein
MPEELGGRDPKLLSHAFELAQPHIPPALLHRNQRARADFCLSRQRLKLETLVLAKLLCPPKRSLRYVQRHSFL